MKQPPNRWFTAAWMLLWSAALASLIGGSVAGVPSSITNSVPSAQPTSLAHRPIEKIQVGDRVLAKNPTGERDDSLGEVDPATWRKVTLRAPKPDGTHADVVLLRPRSWLQERDAHTGGTIEIAVPECGIDGHAEVLRIDPCPPLKPGNGQVVTGTYKHQSARILDLWIEGQSEPIGTTANHPFWSEDRGEFVRADQLRIGERLRTVAGVASVARVETRAEAEAVYNIEVHGSRVYSITHSGIVVHNANVRPLPIVGACFDLPQNQRIADYIKEKTGFDAIPNPREGVQGMGRQGDALIAGVPPRIQDTRCRRYVSDDPQYGEQLDP